ncbi:MAG: histidinol-phosphate transaminase [Lachnospiraceae bacterium]|nr:histidinol-phosphate transaminase [Lachnospiraceae bacterium]
MKWEENVRKVIPYVPGEQPKKADIVKLNTNECPYPPSPMIQKAMEAFPYESLRRYPDPQATRLVTALADNYGLEPENVFVGVGSDDVLAMAFLTFFNSGKKILFPDITYSFYDVWADLFRIPYKCKPLDEEFRIRKEDYFEENGGVIFPNPNAPTGVEESVEMIEEIIRKNQDVVVIIDEAYIDFGGKSVLPLIHKYENLLVVRTFSKSRALAGVRIGYAFGSQKLIKYLNDAKFSFNSYTMNSATIEMGCACLQDKTYFQETVEKIIATRERVKQELSELGFVFPDSKANFIFAKHKTAKAKNIFEAAKQEGIYVRYFNKPRIDDYLRISIGTDEEMDRLLAFLKRYLG